MEIQLQISKHFVSHGMIHHIMYFISFISVIDSEFDIIDLVPRANQ